MPIERPDFDELEWNPPEAEVPGRSAARLPPRWASLGGAGRDISIGPGTRRSSHRGRRKIQRHADSLGDFAAAPAARSGAPCQRGGPQAAGGEVRRPATADGLHGPAALAARRPDAPSDAPRAPGPPRRADLQAPEFGPAAGETVAIAAPTKRRPDDFTSQAQRRWRRPGAGTGGSELPDPAANTRRRRRAGTGRALDSAPSRDRLLRMPHKNAERSASRNRFPVAVDGPVDISGIGWAAGRLAAPGGVTDIRAGPGRPVIRAYRLNPSGSSSPTTHRAFLAAGAAAGRHVAGLATGPRKKLRRAAAVARRGCVLFDVEWSEFWYPRPGPRPACNETRPAVRRAGNCR